MIDIIVIIGLVGLIIIIVTAACIVSHEQSAVPHMQVRVRGTCVATGDCDTGLTCESNVCMIPHDGSCTMDPDACIAGYMCFKGRCIADTPQIPISTPNVPQDLHVDDVSEGNLSFGYYPNAKRCNKFNCGRVSDAFYHDNMIYTVAEGTNRIDVYSMNAEYLVSHEPNIEIASPLEVVQDYVYTVCDGYLYRASLTSDTRPFVFVKLDDKCEYAVSDPGMTRLVVRDGTASSYIVPGLGTEFIEVTQSDIIHSKDGGVIRSIPRLPNTYPLLFKGAIYSPAHRTRGFYDARCQIFLTIQ